jgi:hypothetical protein
MFERRSKKMGEGTGKKKINMGVDIPENYQFNTEREY